MSVRQQKPGMARRVDKKKARQHSKFVRAARMSLPVVIVGIVAAYGVTATPRTIDKSFLNQFQNLDVAADDLRMEQPKFVGEDTQGRPYEVNAGAAVQDPAMPKFIALEDPEAFKALGNIDQSLVSAKTGLYSIDAKTIELNSEVEFTQGIGTEEFRLTMDAAEVHLENRTVHSDVRVYGENQSGSISADGMTAYQEDGRTEFYNARMIIKPKKADTEPGGSVNATEPNGVKEEEQPET